MAFIIPNATDYASGKYASLDQAEPDALDFEILGNRSSGVLSGCEVTYAGAINVSAGSVVINNVAYQVSAVTALAMPTAPTTNRFDLVIVRLNTTTSVASVTTLAGTESATNPTFPKSAVRAIAGTDTVYVDPATDVVLAAVYRSGSLLSTARIVDKRASLKSNISLQGTTAPDNTALGSNGDLYFRSNGASSSGVYAKYNNTWNELAKYPIDPGVPIGSLMMWPLDTDPNSSVWIEAKGTNESRTTYAQLFSVYQTTYGAGDGSSTFGLPDYRGFYLAGKPAVGGTINASYGSNTVTIGTANLPQHSHTLSGAGTAVTVDNHQHGMTHKHTATTGQANTDHQHTFSGTTDPTTAQTNQNLITTTGSAPGYATSNTISSIQSPNNNVAHQHTFSGTTNASGGGHSHPISVDNYTNPTDLAGSHQHVLSGSTDSTGSGTPLSIQPATKLVRFFIRYA
jgi:microcystin-dependent protein